MRFLSEFYLWMALALVLVLRAQTATSAEQSSISRTEQEYLSSKPQWGVEISGSGSGLGTRYLKVAPPGLNETVSGITAVNVQMDFQPSLLQKYGVVGIGPSLSLFTANNVSGHPKLSLVWAWAGGVQARYQLKYFEDQFLVPMIGYSAEFFSYQLRTRQMQGFLARGPMAGGWLNLGSFDRTTATSAYRHLGISRTYLIFEGRRLRGWDNNVGVAFNAVYMGLRFEY